MQTNNVEQLEYVNEVLEQAKEWGLEAEVVLCALNYMKQTPALSIEDAITFGFEEWVK